MQSGALRFILEVLTPTPRRGEFGEAGNDWVVAGEIRAAIHAVSTTERAAFGGKQAVATHTITCRYFEGWSNKMRLRLKGTDRVFETSDVRQDQTQRRRLTIKAQEITK